MPSRNARTWLFVLGTAFVAALFLTVQRSRPAPEERNAVADQAPSPDSTATRDLPGGDRRQGAAPPPARRMDTVEDFRAERRAQRAEISRTVAIGRDAIASRYAAEAPDPAWAAAKERVLTERSRTPEMAARGALPADFAARCKSSTCRITATFDSRATSDDWFILFTTSAGADMPRSAIEYKPMPDGSIQVEIYGSAR